MKVIGQSAKSIRNCEKQNKIADWADVSELCFWKKFVIIIIIPHFFNVDRSKSFKIKNVYKAVAMPINNKDGMVIKVNEKKKLKQNTMVKRMN